jgi:alkanesulfonate monooxygenase SsuD/methylene tetrahydromethanopterin reductase-like flavin-dependent oxidoreductase (luciferase family)
MFANPPGLLRLEPHSEGLRDRIWCGAGSNATAVWAAKLGMSLQSSTLKSDETGEPFHVQQSAQIRAFRAAWKAAGHSRTPRVSIRRSIFALVNDLDRAYFGRGDQEKDTIGFLDAKTRAIFGRSYAQVCAEASDLSSFRITRCPERHQQYWFLYEARSKSAYRSAWITAAPLTRIRERW